MKTWISGLALALSLAVLVACQQPAAGATSATTYTLTYDGNGADSGTAPVDAATYHQFDAVTVTSGQGSLVKDGYNLAGWMTAVDGTGTSYAAGAVFAMGAGNATLHAVWVPSNFTYSSSGTSITLLQYSLLSATTLNIPSGVTQLGTPYAISGEGALQGCNLLTSITLPPSLVGIGNYAFFGCTGLTSLTIPSGVTSIGNFTFQNCTGLTSLTIPSGVTSIGSNAFQGCTGLTSLTIPSGVTSIGQYTFNGCTGLTSLTIPSGVTSISANAFNGCTGLTSLTIPSGVTSIGGGVFRGCTGLTSLTIPSGVTSIGTSAFQSCTGLTSLTIPSGVTSIGVSAFNGCTFLATVTIMPTTPPTLGLTAFTGLPTGYQLKVPAASVATYKAATNWITWAANIVSQ